MLRDFVIFMGFLQDFLENSVNIPQKWQQSHSNNLYGKGANVHGAIQNVTPVKQWRSQDFIFDSKEVESHPMFW